MSDYDHDIRRDVVCGCSGTTEQKIRALIESDRAKTLNEISRITGACSGCGACEPEILRIMAEFGF